MVDGRPSRIFARADDGAPAVPRRYGASMTKKMRSPRQKAHRSAVVSGTILTGMGVLHLVKPEPFERLIPAALPGTPRQWAVWSGYAELATAALLLAPRTRAVGGAAAAGLYLAVWPGNMKMAWDRRHRPAREQVISLGRLPLQIPMIRSALRIARNA